MLHPLPPPIVELVISSTVLFFNLVYKLGNTKAKNRSGTNVPDPGKLVHSSSVVAFQIARVIRCSVVDIKRTVDISPLKRIRLRSHAAIELKANGSVRAQKLNVRWTIVDINSSSHAGEQIDACSKTEHAVSIC